MKSQISNLKLGTWVCFAVAEECSTFKRRLWASNDIQVLISGMGRRNARQMFNDALRTSRPRLVLTCGFAGALKPGLNVGDVLFDEDPQAACGETLRSLGATRAVFHCSERVAVTAAEKIALHQETGADAVEMESGVIRGLCREQSIPALTLRAISDRAEEDLPIDFNKVLTPDSRLSPIKFAAALARSPGAIPGLIELRRNCAIAARRLSEVLCGLLHVP